MKAHGIPQAALRYLIEQGIIPIPRAAVPISRGQPCCLRFHAQPRRDGRDRPPQESGRPRGQSAARAALGCLKPMSVPAVGRAHIPLIGLGTWDLRGRTCVHMVERALRLGYRHVDTAEMYDNEREVGEGPGRAASNASSFIAIKGGPRISARATSSVPQRRVSRDCGLRVLTFSCSIGQTRRFRCARHWVRFARSSAWALRATSAYRISPWH